MIRRWVAFAAAVLLACLACVFFACGGPEFVAGGGAEDAGPALDAGDAGVLDASHPHDASGGGDAAGPQDSGVVYVSVEAGSDTNSGLSPEAPKRTLVAAIATAIALDAGAEVHACAGTYAETQLNLNGAVSLRGAYDCATWARTATFGYPVFDHVNDTVVENANPALRGSTLVVSNAVPASSVVDGLTIVGSAVLDGTTTGVIFEDEASPVLRDDTITGGGGQQTTGFGSIGVYIDGASAAEVVDDAINGGTGTPGSVGVEIRSTATPHVHDDLVSGGLGNAPIGIYVQSGVSGADSLFGLEVSACDSPGVTGSAIAIQINAPDAGVDVVSSLVNGCAGVADAGASSVGIRATSVGALNVLEDRVFGGTRSGAGAYTAGVQVVAASTATVRNSMLHGGEVTGGSANGLSIVAAGSANIQDDTVYAGAEDGTSIVVLGGAENVKVTNVIVLGGGTGQTHAGIFAASCSGILSSLDHDLFANYAAPIYACNLPDGGAGPTAQTPEQLEALLSVASDDLAYASTAACSDDAGDCVASPPCPGTPTACLGALFGASWTSDDGVTGLFPSTAPDGGTTLGGWTLPAGAPCAIARGGVPVAGISTDLFGNPRNPTTPTIGAAELLGTCTP
jgi:hypothetical protein